MGQIFLPAMLFCKYINKALTAAGFDKADRIINYAQILINLKKSLWQENFG